MNATLKDGKLTIVVELDEEPRPSSSEKMLLYHYSKWDDLGIKHADFPLRGTVTIGIKNPDYGK